MSVKVSILIPTYNRANYLRESINSALVQTHSNVELLILDDASLDNTSEVVAEFKCDDRIRYIRHKKNIGVADNWHAGITIAQGDFFCILHDDDTLEPQFIEQLLTPLVNDSRLSLSFCDHWTMGDTGIRDTQASEHTSSAFKRDILPPGRVKDFASCALINASIPIGASLFRRSIVQPTFINHEAKGSIDLWLLYQIAKVNKDAYYVPKRIMNYRRHDGGMRAAMPVYMREGHIFRYRSILADEKFASIHDDTRQSLASGLSDQGEALLIRGKSDEAKKLLREALTMKMSPRTVAAYGLANSGYLGSAVALAMKKLRDK